MHTSSGMGQRLKIWDKSWTYLLARILRRGSHFQGSGSCTRCCCLLAWNFPFSQRSDIVSSETCLLGTSVPIDWSTHKHNNNRSAWLLSALTSKPVRKVCKNVLFASRPLCLHRTLAPITPSGARGDKFSEVDHYIRHQGRLRILFCICIYML